MKITALTPQQKSDSRVNVMVDGKYRFSLDIYQVVDLGIKVGNEYSETELNELETESQFGKLYARALEYTMLRPHSAREIKDYLWRKTRATKYKSRTGELKERAGVSQEVADRVFERLADKGHIDDERFATWWIENRNVKKGASRRKLTAELRGKGIGSEIIDTLLAASSRSDENELQKMIEKKAGRYSDSQKLMQYLVRQGFSYDDIKSALEESAD